MADTAAFDAWVKDVLGVDPGAYEGAGQPGASARGAGEGDDAATDLLDAGSDQAAADTAAPAGQSDEASAPPAPVKLVLKSQTEVSQPSNRARTKLGVGERVNLELKPVAGEWKASGAGSVKPDKGSKVVLTASGKPGKVTVTVTAQGQTEEIVFTVVAPDTVHQDTASTEHYNVGVPNAGFHGQIYVGPDDVNFVNITFLEDEIGCDASGSWAAKKGKGHGPNKTPLGFSDRVVRGKGTMANATDHCWSGYVPGLKLTDWTGEMTFRIPWNYQCNGQSGRIATVVQTTSTTKDGTTRTDKAGGSSGDWPLS
jgi:hypothetical protein